MMYSPFTSVEAPSPVSSIKIFTPNKTSPVFSSVTFPVIFPVFCVNPKFVTRIKNKTAMTRISFFIDRVLLLKDLKCLTFPETIVPKFLFEAIKCNRFLIYTNSKLLAFLLSLH